MPPMYLPYRMRNPAAVEGLMPSEYTRPEQVAATVRALETHDVPLLILVADGKYPRATGLLRTILRRFAITFAGTTI